MISGDTPISRSLATFLVRFEKYVLPLFYAYQAWRQVNVVWKFVGGFAALSAHHTISAALQGTFAIFLIRHVLLLVLMVFCGATLALSRAPTVLPDKLKHILPPLAMSFYFLLYTWVDLLPHALQQNFLPREYRLPFGLTGIVLSILGYSLNCWALLYLRRAFGLFVSVRDVVRGGPYAYLRHPIYAGYLLDSLGLLAVNCSIAMLVLLAGFVILAIYRAGLEEEKLAEASGEYALYRSKTGFFFPRRSRGIASNGSVGRRGDARLLQTLK